MSSRGCRITIQTKSGIVQDGRRTKDGCRPKDKGQMIAVWTKFRIAKDERRTKDNYLDEVWSSPG
jgi:hypothetical protein